MESNSDTDSIEKIYSKFNIIKIKAKRNINYVASKRGPLMSS
jgi:site-specific DNA-adenine methylase